jgi:hypothetical protein
MSAGFAAVPVVDVAAPMAVAG